LQLLQRNKTLGSELRRYKRQFEAAKKEIQLVKHRSREMEALISVIQRAWSQLDIDVCMFLDCLGDSVPLAQNSEYTGEWEKWTQWINFWYL